ncbi:hypothetical protein PMAYCL1PPCAC_22874, partial [Pristionchus mayeri]
NCFRLVFASCFFGITKSVVHFKNSLILDEFDLSGNDSVSLDEICLLDGCNIYVSSIKNAEFIYNLSFQAGTDDEVGLWNYTYDHDETTRQKIPFVVKKGDSVSIINANDDLFCGPIVVYAISNSAPNFDVAGVYDVLTGHTKEEGTEKIVTIMGARPFTVWASSPDDAMEASVFTTGFDIEDAEKCAEVYHSTRGLDIKYGVNGPITTLFFDEEMEMNVDFVDFFDTDLDLSSATFISSPGFIGCGNAEVYHSSVYESQVNFKLSYDLARTTRLSSLLNTDDPLTLRLDGDPTKEKEFTGHINDDSYTQTGEVSAMELSFSMSMTSSDSSFLVHFTDLGISPNPNPCKGKQLTGCEDSIASCAAVFPVGTGDVPSAKCFNTEDGDFALTPLCRKTCQLCCQDPAFDCDDDPISNITCPDTPAACNKASDINFAHCQSSCGWCQLNQKPCLDITDDPTCAQFEKAGLCTDPEVMNQCEKTCEICIPEGCVDSSPRCPIWVSNGFCTDPFYDDDKADYCKRSCKLC